MPIHDWTRVNDGAFHDFHVVWIGAIRTALNDGLLPPSYYAQAEQIIGPLGPDVLTLQRTNSASISGTAETLPEVGTVAVASLPVRPQLVGESDMEGCVLRRRAVVVRHVSGNRIVALIEIVSPGNKSSERGLWSYVEKAVEALYRGFHLLVVDLFPPTPRDPQGIHGAIWAEVSSEPYTLPTKEPLTLAAYSAGPTRRAYVEQTAVGRELIEMPLFLEPEVYVNVPLETTYLDAYRGVPRHLKQQLEATQ